MKWYGFAVVSLILILFSKPKRHKMKIHTLSIRKKDLSNLTKDELYYFITIGRILNEINVLHKISFLSHTRAKSKLEIKADNLQRHVFMITLAGKMYEAWEVTRKVFLGSKDRLPEKYRADINTEGWSALGKIKGFFRKTNCIELIRNEVAFHYDINEIMKVLDDIEGDSVFEMHLSEDQGNCVYGMSFTISLLHALKCYSERIPLGANVVDEFSNELRKVSLWFIVFLNQCLVGIVKHHSLAFEEKEEIVKETIHWKKLYLPYFIEK